MSNLLLLILNLLSFCLFIFNSLLVQCICVMSVNCIMHILYVHCILFIYLLVFGVMNEDDDDDNHMTGLDLE